MCTVTIFFNKDNDFVLTSSRDEAPNRVSLAPKHQNYKGTILLYPEDKLRGVVVKDLLALKSIQDFSAYNFFDIEPFTLVITDWNSKLAFYELVWDGKRAHFNQLELNSHIWSSSTLYSKEKRLKRKKWFAKFEQNNALSADSVLLFHKTAGKGNDDFGVIMDRGYVKTTSITQVIKNDKDILLRYESFQENSVSLESFKSSEVINE